MSVAATTWAWAQPSGHGGVRGNDRLVLLAIADAADAKGENAWPAIETVAGMAGLSERTIQRSIRSLEQLGILCVEKQAGGDQKTRSDRRPNRYTLLMDGVTERHPVASATAVDNSDHGVTLPSPREIDGVTEETTRGDKSGHHGVTELCHPNKGLNKNRTIAPTKVDAVEIASLRTAILAACEIDPDHVTPSAGGPINKATHDLVVVGAQAGDVPAAAKSFRDRFPAATLTPLALAKHWPQLTTQRSSPPALTEPERFGISLGRFMVDRVEAEVEIESQFDDAFDRAAAVTAWERTRRQEATG